jgi:hypothetical protein
MEDDDLADTLNKFLHAEHRPVALHEAGHAVVAHALGVKVKAIVVDFAVKGGRICTPGQEVIELEQNLAICMAGCRAERRFNARTKRTAKDDDFAKMRALLETVSEMKDRHAALSDGYALVNAILNDNIAVVSGIACALLARRGVGVNYTTSVCIEDDELGLLLAEVRTN